MKKVLLCVNTASGTGEAAEEVMDAVILLSRNDCLVTVYPIVPAEGLVTKELITEKAKDYDIIACAGGDGTLNHIISELMDIDLHGPIGYLPFGSTNDFYRNINRGRDLSFTEKCLAITSGEPRTYDIGCFNEHYFNYVAAFGAFTKVSYTTPQDMKNALGYGAYVLSFLANMPDIGYRVHMVCEHDGIKEEGVYSIGMISNSTSVAGVQSDMLSDADLNDGLFEVILVKAPDNLMQFSDIIGDVLAGQPDHEMVSIFKTSEAHFVFDRDTAWTLDGEDGIPVREVHFKVCRGAMTIMVLPEKEKIQ